MNIVLGVTGGIAAYKAADLVSRLKKRGIQCNVIMTKNATEFVSPLTFESLSGNPVAVGMFDPKSHWEIEHISLAKKADLFVVAPATANVIGKLACGIADDMLTTTAMATRAPIVIAPAMNTAMYESAAVRHNLNVLRERGVRIIAPDEGLLACGDVGRGKLAPVEEIEEVIIYELYRNSREYALLENRKVLVTAGPTVAPIDPVRYLTNRSSGKMGYAFAEVAAQMGAEVILVSGPTHLRTPYGVERIDIRTTEQLLEKCMMHADADYIIMAAAPSDIAACRPSDQKIKYKNPALPEASLNSDLGANVRQKDAGADEEGVFSIAFRLNPDVIGTLGADKRKDQVIVAFAAETENMLEHARRKLLKKNADYLVANDVTRAGAGFDVDTNIVTLLSADGGMIEFPLMTKRELAENILKVVAKK